MRDQAVTMAARVAAGRRHLQGAYARRMLSTVRRDKHRSCQGAVQSWYTRLVLHRVQRRHLMVAQAFVHRSTRHRRLGAAMQAWQVAQARSSSMPMGMWVALGQRCVAHQAAGAMVVVRRLIAHCRVCEAQGKARAQAVQAVVRRQSMLWRHEVELATQRAFAGWRLSIMGRLVLEEMEDAREAASDAPHLPTR